MTFVNKKEVDRFVQTLEKYLETTLKDCAIRVLEIDAQGVYVKQKENYGTIQTNVV